MRAIREFIHGLMRLPMVWKLWLAMLAAVNGLVPLFFWNREGPVVLGVFVLAGILGIGLTHLQGFTKLLGLMHFPWFVLIGWLLPHLADAPAETWHGQWLRLLIAMNATSLVIDVKDLVQYALGQRDPT